MKSLKQLALLALLVVALASCTKEEAVHPCNSDTEAEAVNAKNLRTTGIGQANGEGSQQEGVTNGGVGNPGTGNDPSGISDDGDDISDGEKSRKKRR